VSTTVVITDLDGTFLDHDSYSYKAALPAVVLLRRLNVPLVFCSSKTRSEILSLRKELANTAPYIVENGAAVCGLDSFGDTGDRVFGCSYKQIRGTLVAIRDNKKFAFTGFADMSVAEVAACTGLSLKEAQQACAREFSEPLIWQDSEANLGEFLQQLADAGLQAQQGGRFLTIAGKTDKGKALNWLRHYYQSRFNNNTAQSEAIRIIALGDSPNDQSMLNAADIAVIIRSQKSSQLSVTRPKEIIYSEEPGSKGWCSAIIALLEEK